MADDTPPDEALHPALPLVLPVRPTREQIDRLEAAMLAAEAAPGFVAPEIPLDHHHAGGLYARQITIPAGTVLAGLPHKHAHLNVCIGDITVWTEQGMRRLTGTHVVPSAPGARRVGLTHADTVWVSIHVNPTGTTDEQELAALLVETPRRLLDNRRQPNPGQELSP